MDENRVSEVNDYILMGEKAYMLDKIITDLIDRHIIDADEGINLYRRWAHLITESSTDIDKYYILALELSR